MFMQRQSHHFFEYNRNAVSNNKTISRVSFLGRIEISINVDYGSKQCLFKPPLSDREPDNERKHLRKVVRLTLYTH